MTKAATPETSTPADSMDFQQAFAAAKEEHSTTEQAPAPEASTDETKDEAPPAADADAPAPAAEPGAKPETELADLISDKDLSALQTKYASDPVKLAKELNRVFTQKTQALAGERKTFDRVKPYVEIIDAYEADPAATLKLLAAENGFEIVEKGSAAKAGETDTTATTTAESAQPAVDAIVEKFREQLGPELEYLADGLAPAIKGLVEAITKTSVDEATKPIKEQAAKIADKAAVEATDTVMTTFGERHPDWKEHEPAMLALATKIQPNGMDELEYLEHLHSVVTRGAWEKNRDANIAAEVKKALKRMEKGATETETRDASTPEGQVRKGPPPNASFQDAFEAAKRGERWE